MKKPPRPSSPPTTCMGCGRPSRLAFCDTCTPPMSTHSEDVRRDEKIIRNTITSRINKSRHQDR